MNFISTIATYRILRKAQRAGIPKQISCRELPNDLSSTRRQTDASVRPDSDDGYWISKLQNIFETLEALGLTESPLKQKTKTQTRTPKLEDPSNVNSKHPQGHARKHPSSSIDVYSPAD